MGQHANGREHGKAPVVELTDLEVVPRGASLPLRGAEEVARLVVRPPAVEDAKNLHEADEEHNLEQAKLRHLHAQWWRRLHARLLPGWAAQAHISMRVRRDTHLRDGEERVRAELAVVERMELVGGDHAHAGKHGDAAVLQLSLAKPVTMAVVRHSEHFSPAARRPERVSLSVAASSQYSCWASGAGDAASLHRLCRGSGCSCATTRYGSNRTHLAIEAGLASLEKPKGSKKPKGAESPTMPLILAWMPWQAGCCIGARTMPLLTRASGLQQSTGGFNQGVRTAVPHRESVAPGSSERESHGEVVSGLKLVDLARW